MILPINGIRKNNMLSVIATLPSATTTLNEAGAWSSVIVEDLWPFAMLAVGVFLGFGILMFIINAVKGGFSGK